MARLPYTVVLVRPRDPNNIGAAARAMKNFGLSDLIIVSPHPPVWQEARSAVGAEDVLAEARVVATIAEAVADCTLVIGTAARTRSGKNRPLLTPAELRRELAAGRERVALVFGPEKTGLTNSDLSFCHRTLSIPTRPACPSMNLGQAVAICCYELTREDGAEGQPETVASDKASVGHLEGLLSQTVEVLSIASFLGAHNQKAMTEELRRSLLRWGLTPREVTILRGALRQIAWKLRDKATPQINL